MSSMLERIENELRGQDPAEVCARFDLVRLDLADKPTIFLFNKKVEELTLDNSSAGGRIEGITDAFVNLRSLSLNGASINSLVGFPKLPNLETVCCF